MDELIYDVKSLRVIVYGLGNSFAESEEYLNKRVNIVGCSDSDESRANLCGKRNYTFIKKDDLGKSAFDFIFIVSIYDDIIFDDLVNKYHIERDKVLARNEWTKIIFKQRNDNAKRNERVYVVEKTIRIKSGLFSYVFTVLNQLIAAERLGAKLIVDMKNYPSIYLDEKNVGIINAWDYFYEQISDIDLDVIDECSEIYWGYDSPDYKTNYIEKYNIDILHEMYVKYISMKPHISSRINKVINKILPDGFKDVLGVLYRGSDMTALKLKSHPVQPEIGEIANLVLEKKNEWKCKTVFLCTEDEKAVQYFIDYFGEDVVYTNQLRFSNTGKKWIGELARDNQIDRYERGVEYIETIDILSKCNHMIAGICTGSICAQIIHGNDYENLIMIEKGMY